jgi:hypothetical protein
VRTSGPSGILQYTIYTRGTEKQTILLCQNTLMEVLVQSPARAEDQSLHPGINHYTQLAYLVRKVRGQDGRAYAMVNYRTDIYGRALAHAVEGLVYEEWIKYYPHQESRPLPIGTVFYHRDKAYELAARGFVDSSNPNGLVLVGRIPLGTGVYGKYFSNLAEATKNILENETIYQMDARGCYPILDAGHGDALTLASLYTNLYLNDLVNWNYNNSDMESTQREPVEGINPLVLTLSAEQLDQLFTLWSIVFLRTGDAGRTTKEGFQAISEEYLVQYHQNTYVNAGESTPLQLLPINSILAVLGYRGIYAVDSYNNSRDRGCVAFDLKDVTKYNIGNAQY